MRNNELRWDRLLVWGVGSFVGMMKVVSRLGDGELRVGYLVT